ncbi:DUF192 domain-containing protein [Novosphingobium panipatense]|jgi:uncharacterized membrane protein (UPF0127 family)|uniref:DUF192 domain-containing protein n=1 Tax=Novosphingobium panipatense TaxID=428991 RepID=A0ABY1Q181_9SPHN|nr:MULTISPECIES: DUF192 domain-containing protein [Novosphingobium]SMP52005.1 hypothetical protein SAMN06296065_101219 [Novosphingobium panipatense]
MRLTRSITALSLLLACAACSQTGHEATAKPTATRPAVHPVSGLPVVPLTVTSANGTHTFQVEVASTTEQQAKGLMFRTEMGENEGMIFPNKPPRPSSFWMHNTVISLDLIFIGPDHRILNIIPEAVPYDETPLRSDGVAAAVLELNGGRAAQLGLKAGDKVRW